MWPSAVIALRQYVELDKRQGRELRLCLVPMVTNWYDIEVPKIPLMTLVSAIRDSAYYPLSRGRATTLHTLLLRLRIYPRCDNMLIGVRELDLGVRARHESVECHPRSMVRP
jgi:hypothetical protein